jgi:hypothetical protein
MKLSEAIYKVDRSDPQWPDVEIFARDLGLEAYGLDSEFAERVKGHYLAKWMCTDTWVGTQVFYLDDEPVAISTQSGRKSDENLYFISKEAGEKVREFILSLMSEDEAQELQLADLDEEIGDHYNVTYGSQLLVKEGFYQGSLVTVVKEYHMYIDIDKWQTIDVRLQNGEVVNISCTEFHIPLHLAK